VTSTLVVEHAFDHRLYRCLLQASDRNHVGDTPIRTGVWIVTPVAL